MTDILIWIACGLQAVGSTAMIFKKKYAWPIWMVSAIMLIYSNLELKSYSQVTLWSFFLLMDIGGWIQWNKQ